MDKIITPKEVTVTTESASKVYDGSALTAGGKVEGIVDGETYGLTVTGSQTEVGASTNSYTLTWADNDNQYTAKESNYTVVENLGTLTVLGMVTYDGNIATSGTAPVDRQQYQYGESITVADKNDLALEEAVFIGWSEEATTLITSQDAEDALTLILAGSVMNQGTTNTTLYAVFAQDTNDNGEPDYKESYTLTVNYTYHSEDGQPVPTLPAPVVNSGLKVNENYRVESPDIDGYVAVPQIVEGTIIDRDVTAEVVYHKDVNGNDIPDCEDTYYTITFRAGANGSLNTGTLVIADVLTGTPFGEAVTSIPTPVANNGYHFTGWNNPIPADDAQVVGNMEFVANFAADPDPDPVNPGCPEGTVWSEEAQACIVPYVPPVTPEDPTDPTDPEGPAEVEEAEEENVEEEETPQQGGETTPTPSADAEEDIADEGTPEAGGRRTAWALVNLIASLLGILAAIVLLVSKHRKEVDSEDEERQMRIDRGEEDPQQVSRSRIYKVISVITAIVSVIVFVLTEDMRQPMILVDRWTLLMVIFLLINVVTLFLGRKWHEEDEEEGQNRA